MTDFERLSNQFHRIADERDKLFEENKVLKEEIESDLDATIRLTSKIDKLINRCYVSEESRDELLKALNWALGADGDFKQKPDNVGNYWWRTELVERANLIWDSDKLIHIQKVEALKC